MSTAEDYILLGLRLGRHVEGLVDAYYGPEALAREVDAEPVADATALVEEADALLGRLEDGWLRDQARGLRTCAGVLAGEELSYSDEAERCYGVRPPRTENGLYATAHERLEELFPGDGSLVERYEAWRDDTMLPDDSVIVLARDVAAELRRGAAALVELPPGEDLVLEEVRDEPWWAFNYYLGGLRSRVVINVDAPTTYDVLVELAAHEAYPRHHTERSVKEQLLARGAGASEESIQLVSTPAALVSEGIAESGPRFVLGGEVGERVVDVFRRHGFDYELAFARAVREARASLRRVSVDAALLVYEEGASPEQAQEYVERWALVSPERAAHIVRFVLDPTWRAYALTYSAGRELCEAWAGGDPARFARLLGEHVRVGELVRAADATAA